MPQTDHSVRNRDDPRTTGDGAGHAASVPAGHAGLALAGFAAGHVVAALSDSFAIVAASRALTALATGTF
jgi:hypothetical protein